MVFSISFLNVMKTRLVSSCAICRIFQSYLFHVGAHVLDVSTFNLDYSSQAQMIQGWKKLLHQPRRKSRVRNELHPIQILQMQKLQLIMVSRFSNFVVGMINRILYVLCYIQLGVGSVGKPNRSTLSDNRTDCSRWREIKTVPHRKCRFNRQSVCLTLIGSFLSIKFWPMSQ